MSAITHTMLVDEQGGDMAFILPHSLIGDAAATASKQGLISGQYSDMRLTMKGQDAGRRSSNISDMLGLGRAPHFQIETFDGKAADFLTIDNDNVPRPDTALLMHFSADLASGAPMLEEVASLLKSGDEVAFRYVSQIAALTQAMANPATKQAEIEVIVQAIADIAKDRPDLMTNKKALTQFTRGLVAQAASQFPSTKMQALVAGLSKPLSPMDLMDQSVQEVIETLKLMAVDETLDDAVREKAEKLIEALQNLPEGGPVPLELFEQLQGLVQSVEGTSYAASLTQQVKTMRGANIIIKARKFGLTTAEIHKMEVLASGLSQADAALQGQKTTKTLSQQVRRAIKSLDSNPLSVAAFAGMSVLAPVMNTPLVQAAMPVTVNPPALVQSIESVTAIQQPIVTQSPLGSPQAEMLKANLGVPEAITTLIGQVDTALFKAPAPVQAQAVVLTPDSAAGVIADNGLPMEAKGTAQQSTMTESPIGIPTERPIETIRDIPQPPEKTESAQTADSISASDAVVATADAPTKMPPSIIPSLNEVKAIEISFDDNPSIVEAREKLALNETENRRQTFNTVSTELGFDTRHLSNAQRDQMMESIMQVVRENQMKLDAKGKGCPPGCVCPVKFKKAALHVMKENQDKLGLVQAIKNDFKPQVK